jgi:hypothetical protein
MQAQNEKKDAAQHEQADSSFLAVEQVHAAGPRTKRGGLCTIIHAISVLLYIRC